MEALASPGRGPRLAAAFHDNSSQRALVHTPVEALAVVLDLNLSKRQYVRLGQGARKRNANIYPLYDSVRQA